MIATNGYGVNLTGQWSKKNNSSEAHGGLRHKALFGSVDKQAPPVNSAAQYGEKPSDWQNGPIAPPSGVSDPTTIHSTKSQAQRDKRTSDAYGSRATFPTADVISLVKNNLIEIREDIEEFTNLALNCEAFSKEKAHSQVLLSYRGE